MAGIFPSLKEEGKIHFSFLMLVEKKYYGQIGVLQAAACVVRYAREISVSSSIYNTPK